MSEDRYSREAGSALGASLAVRVARDAGRRGCRFDTLGVALSENYVWLNMGNSVRGEHKDSYNHGTSRIC